MTPVELWDNIKAANGTTNVDGRVKHVRFSIPPPEWLKRELLTAGWTVEVTQEQQA